MMTLCFGRLSGLGELWIGSYTNGSRFCEVWVQGDTLFVHIGRVEMQFASRLVPAVRAGWQRVVR